MKCRDLNNLKVFSFIKDVPEIPDNLEFHVVLRMFAILKIPNNQDVLDILGILDILKSLRNQMSLKSLMFLASQIPLVSTISWYSLNP